MGRLYIEYISKEEEDVDSLGRGKPANLQNPAIKKEELKEGALIFTCKQCGIHLADNVDFVSKDFRGKTGAAFLFDKVINVFLGPESEKEMRTGLHVVSDVYCAQCSVVIGWTYLRAYEQDQKYKEGKFIIERSYLKPLGENSEKYWAPDGDSDDEQAIRFTRLLAGNRSGRPTSAAGINLQ
mmetsp:Transcript_22519/g.30140  ORF Transcript_22519/g.30140 Transcript_22519/m.30140 type:complete len:182 (+) Transcript_22519:96-641(+)|eukprot:CAMPEP_0185577816 /NCGR_PEP_ID=MMETSP0434-20130131/11112_1 /TAXON_ID=626734 ORGANISM="Favella taraikaensis, Strain Fe Narragansett Bay" /NCGR_SAMPLE_ID=MMETSP0434 /ASSEMBLY_ACC=CAM_ASM_000379 /LENGTH=181 /DNA_ID=CAMNT_0028195481 /DNA_START=52 /DNA_END=597 /DNA_ORIENTATION=+